MVNFAGYNQKGQEFVVNPLDENDPNDIKALDLTGFDEAYICIKQPDGTISNHLATVTGGTSTVSLIGSRIDNPEQTIDDTYINDGNNGEQSSSNYNIYISITS